LDFSRRETGDFDESLGKFPTSIFFGQFRAAAAALASKIGTRRRLQPTNMAREDEEPFTDCVVCFGQKGRERRSDGAAVCKFDGCSKEYTRRNRERAGDGISRREAPPPSAPPAKCRKIKDVLGVSTCLLAEMDADERRVGRKSSDDDIQIQVRGGFGGTDDKAEDLIPDTRWVQLADLLDALDKKGRKKLHTFAEDLKEMLEDAEDRLCDEE